MSAEQEGMRLILNGRTFRLAELAQLSDVWWFILDYGELFVPLADRLTPGLHDVSGTMETVEPYMTAGRFSFRHCSNVKLRVLERHEEAGFD